MLFFFNFSVKQVAFLLQDEGSVLLWNVINVYHSKWCNIAGIWISSSSNVRTSYREQIACVSYCCQPMVRADSKWSTKPWRWRWTISWHILFIYQISRILFLFYIKIHRVFLIILMTCEWVLCLKTWERK
jgi:hypothetical protein